jgi:hypothetical protein
LKPDESGGKSCSRYSGASFRECCHPVRPHHRAARFLGYPGPAAGALSRQARDSSDASASSEMLSRTRKFFFANGFHRKG